MTLGECIQQARKRKKMTQGQLADGLCDRSYISLLENDKVTPSAPFLTQVLRRVDLTLQDANLETKMYALREHATQLGSVRRYLRLGEYGSARALGESLWWQVLENGDANIVDQTAELILQIHAHKRESRGAAWLQSAYYYYLCNPRHQLRERVGSRLQQVLYSEGRTQEAISLGRFILRQEHDPRALVCAAVGTASAFLTEQKWEEAESMYTAATEFWQPAQGLEAKAWPHHGLSAVYANLLEWDRALDVAVNAMDLYAAVGSHQYWDTLINVGIIKGHLGRRHYHEAIHAFEQAYNHFRVSRPDNLRTLLLDCIEVAQLNRQQQDVRRFSDHLASMSPLGPSSTDRP